MNRIIENKRIFKFIVISLFLLLLIVISTLAFKKNYKKPESAEYSIEKFSKVEDAVYFFGNQRKYVLLNNNSDFNFGGGRFAYTTERKVMTKKDGIDVTDEKRMPKSDYWRLRLYDYSTENLAVIQVDLNKAVEEYRADFYPIRFSIFTYHNNPKNTINIDVKNKKGIFKTFVLNINTGKVEGEFKERSDKYDTVPNFYYTTLGEYVKGKGYFVDHNITTISDFQKEGKNLNTNINLFKDYPEIEEKIKDDWIFEPQEQYVTPEEWFNKVLYWMAPQSEEKLTIYGVDKKGQVSDIPITTYEEYQAWIQKQESERSKDEAD